MQTINIHDAKTHLSRLLEEVAAGEEIIIAKAGKPMAKLVPIPAKPVRQFGLMAGQIQFCDDPAAEAALDAEIAALFNDSPLEPQ
jgi:prevent-host-death family protein